MVGFSLSVCGANIYKIHGYAFRIIQHFATKLCSFTNFKMHSSVVRVAWIKIFSIMGVVYYVLVNQVGFFHIVFHRYLYIKVPVLKGFVRLSCKDLVRGVSY